VRRSKPVGFVVICLGFLAFIGAAVLPVSPATQRLGPFKVDIRGDNCGPAGYVLYDDLASDICQEAAQRRLLATGAVGVLVVALGMALFAGGDAPHGSRIQLGAPTVSRREARRSRGSRRYMPG
jgi:hypothetical protein